MEDYGLALKQLRKYFGYTQHRLAARIGVTNQAVSKWENGINQPDISMLRSICGVYGITTEQFFLVAAGEDVATVIGGEAQAETAATEEPDTSLQEEETPVPMRSGGKKALWIALLSVAAAVLTAAMVLLIIFLPNKPILEGIESVQVRYYVDGELYTTQAFYEGGTPPTPEKEGYEFLGWYTREQGGQRFDFGNFGDAERVTLYARFSVKQYELTFTSWLHTTSYQMKVDYGASWQFPEAVFEDSNYSLTHWMDERCIYYPLGSQGVDLKTLGEGNMQITFTAVWEYQAPIVPPTVDPTQQYYAMFYAGGDNNRELSYAQHSVGEQWKLPACTATYEGYTFSNWYCNQTKQYYSAYQTVSFEGGRDYDFVAQWTPITYTVLYTSELHDTPFSQQYEYDHNYKIPTELSISKEGYMLVAWSINGTHYEPNDIFRNLTNKAETIVAVAIWEKIRYKIYAYKDDYYDYIAFGPYDWDEMVAMPAADTFEAASGYVFDCWVNRNTKAEYAAGEIVTKLPSVNDSIYTNSSGKGYIVEVQARWKATSYTISFDGNGATGGSMQPQSFAAMEVGALQQNAFTKDGYVFAGWEADKAYYYNGYAYVQWDEYNSYYGDAFFGSLDGYYLNGSWVYNFLSGSGNIVLKARWVKALQGAGTASSPYLVQSLEDLQAISYLVDNHESYRTAHYLLTKNITFGVTDCVRAIGFSTSVTGVASIAFAGVFDGGGHTLKNVAYGRQINLPTSTTLDSQSYTCALFGYVTGGTIRNLAIESNLFPQAGERYGGIVGAMNGGALVERCSAKINNAFEYRVAKSTVIGGLVGTMRDSTIRDCFVTGQITGTFYTGTSASSVYLGGLVASAGSGAIVERCYTNVYMNIGSTGTAKARHFLGGLIGSAEQCTVRNCFVGGYIYAKTYSDFTGLILGYTYYLKAQENLYWEQYEGGIAVDPMDAGISGVKTTVGEARTMNELYSLSWLVNNLGFSEDVWQEGETFPTLKGFH